MYEEITPRCPLNRYVEAFWHSRSNANHTHGTAVYPDCCADIIFTFSPSSSKLFISGAMTTARSVDTTVDTSFVGIRFNPGFAGFFMPSPVNEYTDLTVSLLPMYFANTFQKINYNSLDFPMIVGCLSTILLKQLASTHCSIAEGQILQLNNIRSNRVSEVADILGTSRRTLHRLFLQHFGLSPTQFSNIKRFRFFNSLAKSDHFTSLADLALASGYYDQADMTRHVKKISGRTPGEFLSQLYNTR